MSLDKFFPSKTPKRTLSSGEVSPAKKLKLDPEAMPQGEEINLPKEVVGQTSAPREPLALSFLSPFGAELVGQMKSDAWRRLLLSEFKKPDFAKLLTFLDGEFKSQTVFPPKDQVFNAYNYCEPGNVKILLLGQDPYHGPKQAHGLSFSVQAGVAIPPSLANIYRELKDDISGFIPPRHGFLEHWAKQGVMLLNAALTVRSGEPNSHAKKGWEKLTDATIRAVSENNSNVVFLLWGAYAQKKAELIDGKKHLIIKTVHPSPLSASKGWYGNKCFSKANAYLAEKGKTPIDWKLPANV